MAHLSKDLFTEWKDGDIIDAPTYVQERELIRTANNHNDETSKDNKQELQDNIDDLAGVGRTSETVKKNAEDIEAVDLKADGIRTDLSSLSTTVTDNKTEQDVLKAKLVGIEEGAEVNQNTFAKVNNMNATNKTDAFTIEGGTGVVVTTDPATKKITLEATGEALPASHGHSHNVNGSDPIPDLIKHIQSANPHGISSETVNHLPVNAFTNADLVSSYPMGLTIMRVDGNNIVPFPYTGGVTTIRVSAGTGYQFFARSEAANTLMFRQTRADGIWESWSDIPFQKGNATFNQLTLGNTINIDSNTNRHVYFRTASGENKALVYSNATNGRLHFRVYTSPTTYKEMFFEPEFGSLYVDNKLVWSESNLRLQGDKLQVLIGGVWTSVGGTQRCVPSNNIKIQETTTRSRTSNQGIYTLVLKHFPEVIGEVLVRAEMFVPTEPAGGATLLLGSPNDSRFQGRIYTTGGSGVAVYGAPPIGARLPNDIVGQFDWRTPLNTQVNFGSQNTYDKLTTFLANVASHTQGGVWTSVSATLFITELSPIYLFLKSEGGTSQIRNVSISYDIL